MRGNGDPVVALDVDEKRFDHDPVSVDRDLQDLDVPRLARGDHARPLQAVGAGIDLPAVQPPAEAPIEVVLETLEALAPAHR